MKLSEIHYQRPNMDTLKQTLENLCTQFENAENVTTQLKVIHKVNELRIDFQTMAALASIRYNLNSFDELYEKEQSFFHQQYPLLGTLVNRYCRILLDSSFRTELEQKLGKRLFEKATMFVEGVTEEVESIEQKMSALEGNYFKILSQGTVTFQGENHSLRGMGKFSQSTDPEVRKAAKDAFYDFWASKAEAFHANFDQLVQLRVESAKTLGFKNYAEECYNNSDYNAEQVSNFNKAVLKYFVPIEARLHERRLKRLGVKELRYYDTLQYKNGNAKLQVSKDEMLSTVQKMFSELSPETGEFCEFMLDNELIDSEIRKGKSSGTFITPMGKYGQGFINVNFNGSANDFGAIVHEMGHGFQFRQTYQEGIHLIEYLFPQSEISEMHALGMELLTWDWQSLFFGEYTKKFQLSHIADLLDTITSCCLVEDFQQFIYRHPSASPTERNQKWLDLNKSYYPYRTEASRENPYLKDGHNWLMNGHIMCRPFYAVDYSLASLCAVQFWMKWQQNKETAWQDYLRLCKAGGKYDYFETLELANLRSPFDENVIREIAELLSDWLKQVDDSGF
ncbi:MAG: M3 family oligoendopeptidase [Chitinophagales bacterium]